LGPGRTGPGPEWRVAPGGVPPPIGGVGSWGLRVLESVREDRYSDEHMFDVGGLSKEWTDGSD